MKNIKFAYKLVIGFGVVLMLTLLVVSINYFGFKNVNHYTDIANDANILSQYILRARQQEKNFGLRGYTLFGDDTMNSVEKFDVIVSKFEKQSKATIDKLKEQHQVDLLVEIQNHFTTYRKAFKEFVALENKKQKNEAAMVASVEKSLKFIKDMSVDQKEKLNNEISSGAKNAAVQDRLKKAEDSNSLVRHILSIKIAEKDYQFTGLPDYTISVANQTDNMLALLRDLKSRFKSAENDEQADMIINNLHLSKQAFDDYTAITNKQDEKSVYMISVAREAQQKLGELREIQKAEMLYAQNRALSISMSAGLISILLGIIFAVSITNSIRKPIDRLKLVSEKIANRDLTADLSYEERKDEFGALMASFSKMVKDLRSQIKENMEAATLLASSTTEISASVSQLASSSNEVATSVSETTTTVEEVKQTAQEVNRKARYVSDTAKQVRQVSDEGQKATDDIIKSMENIREQMTSIGDSIMKLSEQTQDIGEIIATVDDMADQSNLLAVNASIEANKAGEHGKGFSVVAQEVRNLAEQSKQATTQVRTILNEIQKATGIAVMSTEQGAKAVDKGVEKSLRAGDSISTLSKSVSEAAQAATQITVSSQEQLAGTDQVAMAMDSIKQATAQNVASSKQLGITAHDLADLGQKIKKLVEIYTM